MVTQNGVWEAADRIRARGKPERGPKERVSVRSVRKELGGGSHEDIGPLLSLWKSRRHYQPVIEQAELPPALQALLARFGEEVMERARIEAASERLADAELAERERAANEQLRDEALAYADLMEARVAALQAEVERLRSGAPAPPVAPSAEPPPPAEPGPTHPVAAFVGMLIGRSLGREADAYWVEVRAAVEAAMRRRGPLPVHALYGSLPASLKERGARIGMPLTPAWLRHHLLRLAETGEAVEDVGGRFALVEVGPPAPSPVAAPPLDEPRITSVPPALSGRRFWALFIAEVHDLLLADGPLSVEGIMDRLPPGWVEATRRHGKVGDGNAIRPGKLREKLRTRIGAGRALEELEDGRFAATGRWPGSRTLDDEEAA